MAQPIISKTGARAISTEKPLAQEQLKQGPSKFDAVREKLQTAPAALNAIQMPPPAQVTAAQRKTLESQLRKRLEGAGSPKDVFKVEMKSLKSGVEALRKKARGVANKPEFAPLRERLNSIEQQFQQSGQLMEKLSSSDSPREFLKVQLQMYQLMQNVEVTSRIVEQVNSGVKQILQTQV